FLFALIIAYPIANMYKEPVLAPIIMLFGLSIFVKGFRSIALLVYDKRLELKQQIKMDLITQTSGLLVMIVWAWIHPSIWALVGGQFVTIFLDVYLSYRMFTGHTSRFTWEKTSVSQLFGFGKWIFISSTISYITIHGDRLIMGKFLTMEELGKYSVAVAWASIIMMLSGSLSNRVLMPYFKMALDDNSNFGKIHRVRNLLNSAFVGVCICLALFGDHLISLLYDDRYSSAGWMLQILALGQVGRSLSGTLIPFMLATGDSFSQMKFSAASAVLLVSFITFGGYFAGGPGVVIAYGLSTLVAHPIMIAYACGNGFNCILEDMGFMLLALFTCLLGWWLMGSPILEEVLFLVDQYSQAA
ncbi:MAG: O-antigen/teichoic acid export membrane protein, partial [Lentisphaeria bacterium]